METMKLAQLRYRSLKLKLCLLLLFFHFANLVMAQLWTQVPNSNDIFKDSTTGKVGIGTVAPAVTLDVIGSVHVTNHLTVDTLFARRIIWKDSTLTVGDSSIVYTTANAIYTDNADMKINCNSSYNFNTILNANGNNGLVGIGTTAPVGGLDVAIASTYGDIVASRQGAYFAGNWPTAGMWQLGGGDVNGNIFLASSTTGDPTLLSIPKGALKFT